MALPCEKKQVQACVVIKKLVGLFVIKKLEIIVF